MVTATCALKYRGFCSTIDRKRTKFFEFQNLGVRHFVFLSLVNVSQYPETANFVRLLLEFRNLDSLISLRLIAIGG